MGKATAYARVQVTVEFTASSWGTDCAVQQIFDQAGREVVNKVKNLIQTAGGRIIGEPKITAVLMADKEGAT